MLERLKAIYNQYEELRQRLELPETYSDPALYARVEREARELQPVAEAYAAYIRAGEDMNAALELQSDPEMRELAQEEYQTAKEQKERLEREIRVLLLPRDPNDQKNVIMEIRGGVGGEEGMLFAADLYRMYTMYAESKGWKIDVANVSETELGGIKEISFVIEGDGAWSRLKFEAGGHRVQRVPRRHRGRAAGDRGRGLQAGSERSEDRHLPFLRRRRPACQQDRERHPHHPPAHGRGVRWSRPSRMPPLPPSARARSAPATGASASAPTTFPKTG